MLTHCLMISGVVLAAPFDLQQTLERAAERAPAVRLAVRALEEAEASSVGAGVPFPTNPRLFLDYRRLGSPPPVDPLNGYNLGLDGTLEISGAGFSRVEEAARRLELARAEFEVARVNAKVQAWAAFVEVGIARKRVVVWEDALRTAERVDVASRERLKNGVAGEPDVATAAVELASVKVQLEEARRLAQLSLASLRQLLDLDPSDPFDVDSPPNEPSEPPALETLLARAVERRPVIALVRARIALLETTDTRLGREAFPKLTYNLGLDAAPSSPIFAFAGVGVELPVAQRNQGPRAIARAQLETERLRLETELRKVRRDVAATRDSVAARLVQLRLLTTSALPAAERNELLVEEGWRAGRFDIFRLTSASREHNRLRRERLETLSAAWSDTIELARASGDLR